MYVGRNPYHSLELDRMKTDILDKKKNNTLEL